MGGRVEKTNWSPNLGQAKSAEISFSLYGGGREELNINKHHNRIKNVKCVLEKLTITTICYNMKKNTKYKQILLQEKKTCTLSIYANKKHRFNLTKQYNKITKKHYNVCLKKKQMKFKIIKNQNYT